MRVLVVEDEPSLAEALAFLLRAAGYDVAVAMNGLEALDKFAEFAPDLILLDLMLPKLNGLEVCRKIRTTSNVAIIILTARDAPAQKRVGLAAGADDYMTKPFSLAELQVRIRAVARTRNPEGSSVGEPQRELPQPRRLRQVTSPSLDSHPPDPA